MSFSSTNMFVSFPLSNIPLQGQKSSMIRKYMRFNTSRKSQYIVAMVIGIIAGNYIWRPVCIKATEITKKTNEVDLNKPKIEEEK